MTPDEIAKLIPDEVVEAGVRAALEAEPHMRDQLRAAIAAALAAWPGAVQNYNWDGSRSRILLPLKTEGA